ncbi:hypothetical protein DIPPA_23467 [Diplonema papillatum]|nr:hypothetical protein DIPPA_23467 [Diplonema papillatum]
MHLIVVSLSIAAGFPTPPECWKVYDAIDNATCVATGVPCDGKCIREAGAAVTMTMEAVDCGNFTLCRGSNLDLQVEGWADGGAPSCDCNANEDPDAKALLPLKEAHVPFSSNMTFRCSDTETDMLLPCLQAGEKIYFQAKVVTTSGFQFAVWTEDGSPLQLKELSTVTDPENDEIFDCFVSETTDDSTCLNSHISRSQRLPPPIVFDPELTITFGFEACSSAPPCNIRLSLKTADGPHCRELGVVPFLQNAPVCKESASALAPDPFFLSALLLAVGALVR